jgi:DNA-binding CsgD family transcriptional regulator
MATLGLVMAQPTPIDRDRLRLVLPLLSMRQRQVACLLLEGYSLRRIGDKMDLSDSTVRSYVRWVRQRIGGPGG